MMVLSPDGPAAMQGGAPVTNVAGSGEASKAARDDRGTLQRARNAIALKLQSKAPARQGVGGGFYLTSTNPIALLGSGESTI